MKARCIMFYHDLQLKRDVSVGEEFDVTEERAAVLVKVGVAEIVAEVAEVTEVTEVTETADTEETADATTPEADTESEPEPEVEPKKRGKK